MGSFWCGHQNVIGFVGKTDEWPSRWLQRLLILCRIASYGSLHVGSASSVFRPTSSHNLHYKKQKQTNKAIPSNQDGPSRTSIFYNDQGNLQRFFPLNQRQWQQLFQQERKLKFVECICPCPSCFRSTSSCFPQSEPRDATTKAFVGAQHCHGHSRRRRLVWWQWFWHEFPWQWKSPGIPTINHLLGWVGRQLLFIWDWQILPVQYQNALFCTLSLYIFIRISCYITLHPMPLCGSL